MSEKVRAKNFLVQINQIKEKTDEISGIVKTIPESTLKKAFMYSVENLEKKIQKYTTVSEKLTLSTEEKELVRKFREGKNAKEKVHEISTPKTSVKKKK